MIAHRAVMTYAETVHNRKRIQSTGDCTQGFGRRESSVDVEQSWRDCAL